MMEHLMTTEEVAEILHVDPATIRRLVNRGDLAAYRIGADYRFAPSDLKDYLQRQRVSGGEGYGADAQEESSKRGSSIPEGDRDRWEKFTGQAKRVLHHAQAQARRFHHTYIGTEHLLLALLDGGENVAVEVLRRLEIDPDQVRHQVEAVMTHGERLVTGEIGLTPQAKKVIALAIDEAQRSGYRSIGTEHLLLALIRLDQGIAASVLKSLEMNLEQARAKTVAVLKSRAAPEGTSPLPAGQSERVCVRCGTRCPETFHFCFNCGQPLIQRGQIKEQEPEEE
jgi:excisionase family DNA binding protein